MGTIDRRPYESATVLNQALLDQSQDSLVQRLEMIVDVETPTGTEHWSDRAKYVDGVFYENRVTFPEIDRTIGDFLSGVLEFSSLELTVNNTDKRYSDRLPGGANFAGWVNRRVEMKIGLAELGSSYITVFEGFVTNEGGFSRDISTFTLVCRNQFDKLNITLPNQALIPDDFPDIEDEFIGLAVPIIYGDWTVDIRPEASAVPAYPVNGLDPLVNGSLDPVDPNAGDTPLRCVISSTPLKTLDTASVTLRRGDAYHVFNSSDIAIIPATDNTIFDITQKNLLIDGNPWIYASGDEIYVKCKGVDLSGYDDNIVAQAKDILTRFTGLTSGDFHASWDDYRDKASPAESAISTIKSRIWFQESAKAIELVGSLLEQVRIEPYFDRNNQFHLTSLHFDEFEANPSFTIRNWDVAKDSFKPQIDERNNFNRAKADFDINPATAENRRSTAFFRNDAAITQSGRAISKLITFPNLYKLTDVENQLKEILKLTSGTTELADIALTSRAFLKDLGDFVKLSIDIGSIEFDSTSSPIVAMIRQLRYTPRTMSIGAKLWLFQMINFPGYTGPAGTVGGYNQTITQET